MLLKRLPVAADGARRTGAAPGVFNQRIKGAQAGANWNQALNIWTTPWALLKSAAANTATARQQDGQRAISFSPPNVKSPFGQMYTVTGTFDKESRVTNPCRRTSATEAITGVEHLRGCHGCGCPMKATGSPLLIGGVPST